MLNGMRRFFYFLSVLSFVGIGSLPSAIGTVFVLAMWNRFVICTS